MEIQPLSRVWSGEDELDIDYGSAIQCAAFIHALAAIKRTTTVAFPLEYSGYWVCTFTTDSVRPERYTPN